MIKIVFVFTVLTAFFWFVLGSFTGMFAYRFSHDDINLPWKFGKIWSVAGAIIGVISARIFIGHLTIDSATPENLILKRMPASMVKAAELAVRNTQMLLGAITVTALLTWHVLIGADIPQNEDIKLLYLILTVCSIGVPIEVIPKASNLIKSIQ